MLFEICSCERCSVIFNRQQPGAVFCPQCHHRADVPIAECDCPMCYPPVIPIPPNDFDRYSGQIMFCGRGFSIPQLQVRVLESRVILRFSCSANPEAWAEVVLSAEVLEDLQEQIGRAIEYREIREAAGLKDESSDDDE